MHIDPTLLPSFGPVEMIGTGATFVWKGTLYLRLVDAGDQPNAVRAVSLATGIPAQFDFGTVVQPLSVTVSHPPLAAPKPVGAGGSTQQFGDLKLSVTPGKDSTFALTWGGQPLTAIVLNPIECAALIHDLKLALFPGARHE